MTHERTTPNVRRAYVGMPVLFIAGDPPEPAPFLMNREEIIRFFRLHDGRGTRFPAKTIQRYRRLGLKTVRVGRQVFFRLDDVLRFLDRQQERLSRRSLTNSDSVVLSEAL